MNDDDKLPYLEQAAEEQRLFHQRKNEIEFGQGFYVLEDGSKSTDKQNTNLFARPKPKDKEREQKQPTVNFPASAFKEYQVVAIEKLRKLGKPDSKVYALALKEWNLLTEAQKQPFVRKAQRSKELYQKQT